MVLLYSFFTNIFVLAVSLFMIIAGIIATFYLKKKHISNMKNKGGVNYVGGNIASIAGGIILIVVDVMMLFISVLGASAHSASTTLNSTQITILLIEITIYALMIIGAIIATIAIKIKERKYRIPVKVKLDRYESGQAAFQVSCGVFILQDDEFNHEFRQNVDPHKFDVGQVYDAFLENKNTYDSIYIKGNHWKITAIYTYEWVALFFLMLIFVYIKLID